MSFTKKWRAFWTPSVALAFDRHTLWSVGGLEDEPRKTATCVALDAKTRAVAAVGDEALALRGDIRARCTYAHYVRGGALVDFDAAETAFRHALKEIFQKGLVLTPRVLVATTSSDVAKRALKDAVTHAGARDVITIPVVMAAAIGAGVDVAGAVNTVIYVDRDWWCAAVIGRSCVLASFESGDAMEHVVVERVWRARSTGDNDAADFDAAYARLLREGVENDDACLSWCRRMREHHRAMIATMDRSDAGAAERGGCWLVGPCAPIRGLREMVEAAWSRRVVVPASAEKAVILGCRSMLGELDAVMKSVR